MVEALKNRGGIALPTDDLITPTEQDVYGSSALREGADMGVCNPM